MLWLISVDSWALLPLQLNCIELQTVKLIQDKNLCLSFVWTATLICVISMLLCWCPVCKHYFRQTATTILALVLCEWSKTYWTLNVDHMEEKNEFRYFKLHCEHCQIVISSSVCYSWIYTSLLCEIRLPTPNICTQQILQIQLILSQTQSNQFVIKLKHVSYESCFNQISFNIWA